MECREGVVDGVVVYAVELRDEVAMGMVVGTAVLCGAVQAVFNAPEGRECLGSQKRPSE